MKYLILTILLMMNSQAFAEVVYNEDGTMTYVPDMHSGSNNSVSCNVSRDQIQRRIDKVIRANGLGEHGYEPSTLNFRLQYGIQEDQIEIIYNEAAEPFDVTVRSADCAKIRTSAELQEYIYREAFKKCGQ